MALFFIQIEKISFGCDDLIFKTSALLQRRGVALSEIYQIYHVRGIPNKKTDLQKNVENANATNTGQIVQYIALNLSALLSSVT